jgi:Histidine kinase-, DNA gyrase B-, and HSP90-like ATPase
MATEVAPALLHDAADNEELLYAAVVQILSEDLYPRKLETLREYVQNASDAIDDWLRISDLVPDNRDEPQIKISIQMRSLIIYDNGIGMLEEDIPKLKRIAYSEKKMGEEAGYKGIGRLAGIAVADKLKISSTSYGDPRLHHFEFRAADMRKDISEKKRLGIQEPASPVIRRHTDIWWTDVDPTDHYTIVEIRDIKDSCSELLEVAKLIEYVGDIGPVDFSPAFTHGAKISDYLRRYVPDYSPKTVYLSDSNSGKRIPIFKPYTDAMKIAEPLFKEIRDPDDPAKLLACSWYSSNADEILSKMRPTGKIFQVSGETVEERRRFAGLVYKLFGFSIGDRSLPERTLWTTARVRAAWFTGEIHVVDKQVLPTTDRSNFVESDASKKFYHEITNDLVSELKDRAQEISDNRKTFQEAKNLKQKFDVYKARLDGAGIERSDLKPIREELEKGLRNLRGRKSTDREISSFQKEVQKLATTVQEALNDPEKLKKSDFFSDLPKDLDMPSKARRVLQIIMDTLQQHFTSDREEYYVIADKIRKAIRAKY